MHAVCWFPLQLNKLLFLFLKSHGSCSGGNKSKSAWTPIIWKRGRFWVPRCSIGARSWELCCLKNAAWEERSSWPSGGVQISRHQAPLANVFKIISIRWLAINIILGLRNKPPVQQTVLVGLLTSALGSLHWSIKHMMQWCRTNYI